MKQPTETYRILVICVLLIAGTVAAFWSVKDADFVNFDDQDYISKNARVQRGLTADNIQWGFTTFYNNNWHPLTWLSYMTDCELFGLNARASHLVNLGFHVANTLLLFLLLRSLTSAIWASAIVAAFFGWHPLHVESVAWIAEHKDVLSTLFWLLTMWGYAEYAKRRCAGWYAATLVFFVLGLMAKAMLVTLPFVLLLMDVWPLRRLELYVPGWLKSAKRLVLEKLPLFALAAGASYATYLAQGEAVRTLGDLAARYRVENALVSYARYLGKTFWPMDLAVFYPYPAKPWVAWQVASAAALVLIISLIALRLVRRRPYLFTGWFWFLGTLVPVIGLVHIGSQAMADRYMYVPLIGLTIAIVWGCSEFIAAIRLPKMAVAGITVVLLGSCAVLTAKQLDHWQDSVALFTHTERITPTNILTLNNLISSFLERGLTNEARLRIGTAIQHAPHEYTTWWHAGNMSASDGKVDEALDHYRKGLRLKPNNAELNFNTGLALQRQGELREAVDYYRIAITNKTGYWQAEWNLAYALADLGDRPSAVIEYLALLRMRPDFATGHYDLATVYLEMGRSDEALRHFREAIRLKQDYSPAHRQIGLLLATKRNWSEARQYLERAIKLDPNDATAHLHLAGVWTQISETEKAVAEYCEAIRLDPQSAGALNNLAWLRATHPEAKFRDGNEAVQLAERACELTQRNQAFLLGTLAAAYAEAGRFENAVSTAQKAIELAESQGQKQVAERNRELLKLYRSSQAWREPVH